MDFVRDNPGEPVPEDTFTHSGRSQELESEKCNCFNTLQ